MKDVTIHRQTSHPFGVRPHLLVVLVDFPAAAFSTTALQKSADELDCCEPIVASDGNEKDLHSWSR
jgi:hypothetical protein